MIEAMHCGERVININNGEYKCLVIQLRVPSHAAGLQRSCQWFAGNVLVSSQHAEAQAHCQHSLQRGSVAKITPFVLVLIDG